jgi:L-aminopeptidase/D-esterase-like protein
MFHAITDVPGIEVGHWTDLEAATGCTVVLCRNGAVGGVDVRGGAPGTRETDLLRPECLVDRVHAVLLSGGSAFGLAAADGVMRYLEEQGIGFDVGVAKVPIVPAAILFDLAIGRADVRPGPGSGYAACEAAIRGPVAEGNVGAGTGATVGKMMGVGLAMKSGLGTASQVIGELAVGALAAVNALGDVVNPATGQVLAGARSPTGEGFADSLTLVKAGLAQASAGQSTTLGVVATNAALNKAQARKVAQMAHDGLARTIRPVHTPFDGDTIFALSTGDLPVDVGLVGAIAAETLAQAVVRAVQAAQSLHGIPAMRDLETRGNS